MYLKKKILGLFSLTVLTFPAIAQTQQGIVKTRGRVVDGQVVAGTRLPGATITMSLGNPQVSMSQGQFSFHVSEGKSFSLVSAVKQGYTLADPEFTLRRFTYSASAPIYVVLEDEEQRQADIKEATDKVRRTLKRELRRREDELDAMREENAITQGRYDSLRLEFARYRQSSEALVNEMAERFASIDFDQLDEFNRQVQMYIENGELVKADSLINTKGSVEKRYERIMEQMALNERRQEEIQREQVSLDRSRRLTSREKEDLMTDLYAKHTIHLQYFQQDSALYCLKMRADIDTTVFQNGYDYATLCYNQKKYPESIAYYNRILSLNNDDVSPFQICKALSNSATAYLMIHDFANAKAMYERALSILEANTQATAVFYDASIRLLNNIGNMYALHNEIDSSIDYYKRALKEADDLFKLNPDSDFELFAMTQHNLGLAYNDLEDYPHADEYFQLALANREKSAAQNGEKNSYRLSQSQNTMGVLYRRKGDYANSEKYYLKAFETRKYLFERNPDAYRESLAAVLDNISNLYVSMKEYKKAESFYLQAMDHKEILFRQSPMAYRSDLALTQNNLGILYSEIGDNEKAEKYYKMALANRLDEYENNPEAAMADVGASEINLGILYVDMGKYDQGIECFTQALKQYEQLYLKSSKQYIYRVISLQEELSSLCRVTEDYANSELYARNALDNIQQLYDADPESYKEDLLRALIRLADLYEHIERYADAMLVADRMLAVSPDDPEYYDFKGELYLKQGDKSKALKMWRKVMKMDPDFVERHPDGTWLYNNLKDRGLIR